MKCVMCAKDTDSFTKNKVCKECDKIYFGEEESSDFRISKENSPHPTDDSLIKASFESGDNLMIECPVCQTKNTEESLYCKKCGVKMSSALEAARRIKMEEKRESVLCMSCGTKNENDSTYCIKCGSLLVMPEQQVISQSNLYLGCGSRIMQVAEKELYSSEHSQEGLASRLDADIPGKPMIMIYGKSMKWFNFFVKFVIPIRIIIIVVYNIVNIRSTLESVSDNVLGVSSVLDLTLIIILMLLLFLSSGSLQKYEKKGFQLVTSYFVLNIFASVLPSGIMLISLMNAYSIPISELLSDNKIIPSLIGGILGSVAFSIPNLIYFYKRRHIFIN